MWVQATAAHTFKICCVSLSWPGWLASRACLPTLPVCRAHLSWLHLPGTPAQCWD